MRKLDKRTVGLILSVIMNILQTFGIIPTATHEKVSVDTKEVNSAD